MSTPLDAMRMQELHLQYVLDKTKRDLEQVKAEIQTEETRIALAQGNKFMFPNKMQGAEVVSVAFRVAQHAKQMARAQQILAKVRACPGVINMQNMTGYETVSTISLSLDGEFYADTKQVRSVMTHLFPAFNTCQAARLAIRSVGEENLRFAMRVLHFQFDEPVPRKSSKTSTLKQIQETLQKLPIPENLHGKTGPVLELKPHRKPWQDGQKCCDVL